MRSQRMNHSSKCLPTKSTGFRQRKFSKLAETALVPPTWVLPTNLKWQTPVTNSSSLRKTRSYRHTSSREKAAALKFRSITQVLQGQKAVICIVRREYREAGRVLLKTFRDSWERICSRERLAKSLTICQAKCLNLTAQIVHLIDPRCTVHCHCCRVWEKQRIPTILTTRIISINNSNKRQTYSTNSSGLIGSLSEIP